MAAREENPWTYIFNYIENLLRIHPFKTVHCPWANHINTL